MENKTKLTRIVRFEPRPNLVISQFTIDANIVSDVWDVDGNKLKFQFTPFTKYLTVYGADVESIYVLYVK